MGQRLKARGTIYQKHVEDRVKEVLRLHCKEHKSIEEIATLFNVSCSTIITDLKYRTPILRRAGVIPEDDKSSPIISTEKED